MKIARVDVWDVAIELDEPYTIAYAEVGRAVNVFLRLQTTDGLIGYGCANPDEEVTGETPASVKASLSKVVEPILRGSDASRRSVLMEQLEAVLPHQPSARAAADMALYNLLGKAAGMPVWKLLGGYRDHIATSVTIGILPIHETMGRARHWREQGFTALKLKGGRDVADDIQRVHAVREAVGPDVELRFDANQGYGLDEAIYFANETMRAGVAMIEQPTPHKNGDMLGEVSRRAGVPVMADEGVLNSRDVWAVGARRLASMVNLKLMKTGGIDEALRASSVAQAAGLAVMVGCMDESVLGIAAGLHFACGTGAVTLADLDGHIGMRHDPARLGFDIREGILYPLDRPGFGVEVIDP